MLTKKVWPRLRAGVRQPVVAYGVTLVWLVVMGALLLHAQPPVTGSDGATLQWRRPLSGQTFNAAHAAREPLAVQS